MKFERRYPESTTNIVDNGEDPSNTTEKTSPVFGIGFALTVSSVVLVLIGFILIKAKTFFTKRQFRADDHSRVDIETSNDNFRYSVHDLCNWSGIPGNQLVAKDDGWIVENITADSMVNEAKSRCA